MNARFDVIAVMIVGDEVQIDGLVCYITAIFDVEFDGWAVFATGCSLLPRDGKQARGPIWSIGHNLQVDGYPLSACFCTKAVSSFLLWTSSFA